MPSILIWQGGNVIIDPDDMEMESSKLKPFKKVDIEKALLRLDMFGGITVNSNEPDNPKLVCFFTPFVRVPIEDGDGTKLKRIIRDQIKDEISIGYLPVLHLGQCYFSKKHITKTDLHEKEENILFSFDTTDPDTETDVVISDLGLVPDSDLISYKHSNLVKGSGFKKIKGRFEYSSSDTTQWLYSRGSRKFTIYIHEMEIVRFYLTNSELSCRRIFTGAFQDSELFTKVVNAIHEEPKYDELTETGRFVYRHGYKKSDALALGRILFEKDGVALKAAQRIHKTLVKDYVNNPGSYIGYPRSNIPFKGKSTIEISGRWLKSYDGYVFLANRIISCTAKFPFRNLSCIDEISRGGDPAAEELKQMGFPNLSGINSALLDDDLGYSVSDQRPSIITPPRESEVGSRLFTDYKNISIKYEKYTPRRFKSSNAITIPEHLKNIIDVSTGECTSGYSNSRPQHITERNVTPSPLSPDLKTFLRILQCLRKMNPEWIIKTIPVGQRCVKEDNDWFSVFPEVSCAKETSVMRQFSYLDHNKILLRRFIAVEIRIENKYLYLFEAQRRMRDSITSKNTSPYIAPMPILLVIKPGYPQCTSDDFNEMIIKTVERSTWPNQDELRGLTRGHTVHGLNAQTEMDMATRIMNLISRNLDVY